MGLGQTRPESSQAILPRGQVPSVIVLNLKSRNPTSIARSLLGPCPCSGTQAVSFPSLNV